MLNWWSKFATWMGLACAFLSGGMVLINALLICYEIAMRKYGQPTSWAIDTTVYLTIWAVYLGLIERPAWPVPLPEPVGFGESLERQLPRLGALAEPGLDGGFGARARQR